MARLRRADTLFVPDPAAGCRLSGVTLASQVLGLDDDAASGQAGAAKDTHAKHEEHAEHADIDARFTFACTQPTHPLRRHETAPQQTVLQQLGQPGSVADVGLAARQDLHVPRVHQQQLEPGLFEHMPHRPPIRPGRFHRDLRHPLAGHPAGEYFEITGEGVERTHLGPSTTSAVGPAHTRLDLLLADIQTGTALHDHVHHVPPCQW